MSELKREFLQVAHQLHGAGLSVLAERIEYLTEQIETRPPIDAATVERCIEELQELVMIAGPTSPRGVAYAIFVERIRALTSAAATDWNKEMEIKPAGIGATPAAAPDSLLHETELILANEERYRAKDVFMIGYLRRVKMRLAAIERGKE